MKQANFIVRQGDILIEQIKSIPQAKKQDNKERIILAYGEATGHHHSIEVTESTESFIDESGTLYLSLGKDTVLEHQEHAKIDLPSGKYKVTIQREYFPDAIRPVGD